MVPICLLDMSYGYYQLIRVVMFAGFGFLLYLWRNEAINQLYLLIYVIGIVLFNPKMKLHLGKEIWQIVHCEKLRVLIIKSSSGAQHPASKTVPARGW